MGSEIAMEEWADFIGGIIFMERSASYRSLEMAVEQDVKVTRALAYGSIYVEE
jgi:hypothetical protein